jgi:hypothetical protein
VVAAFESRPQQQRPPGGRAAAWWSRVLAAVVVVAAGCGGPGGGVGLSGQVTVAGTPLERGVIELHAPAGGGPVGGAAIRAGRYAMPKTRALVPGDYRVVIRAPSDQPAPYVFPLPAGPAAEAAAPPPSKAVRPRIPPEFGDNSTLTVTLEAGKDVAFDVVIP